jgi:pimeloyl-ACP methyl ester carboxylesterase
LDEISCPTLVIVGELDEETPVSYAEAIAAGIRDSRLAVIPGVGHLSPAEAPERFNALVREFLA